MSESNTAPAPAAAPAAPPPAPPPGLDADISYAPPPNTQPQIGLSAAARLLANARAARAREAAAAPPPAAPPPAAATVPGAAAAPASGQPPTPAPRGMEAMREALGLPPAEGVSRETLDSNAALPAEIEIEGKRWSHEALRGELAKAQDYTFKTQQLAQQARELQMQQQALAQFLPLVQPELEALQKRLAEAPRPAAELRNTDPAAYWDQFARWQEAQAEGQRVMQVMGAQQRARDAAMAQAVEQANQELARKYPFWSDPAQRREIQNDVVTWAKGQGYTDQELGSLTSARYLETLIKASLYDKHVQGIRTRAPTPAVGNAPVRGAPPPPQTAQAVQQAESAFDSAPNIRNAAALIAARRSGRPNGHTQW